MDRKQRISGIAEHLLAAVIALVLFALLHRGRYEHLIWNNGAVENTVIKSPSFPSLWFYNTSDTSVGGANAESETLSLGDNIPDTSVIIITGLTSQFPRIDMMEQVVRSLRFLQGIHRDTPVYISIEGLDPNANQMRDKVGKAMLQTDNPMGDTAKNRERLLQYISVLNDRYRSYPNVHVIPAPNNFTHLHIGGTVAQGLQHVTTPYVYILQHDLPFRKAVNHTACIRGMKQYPEQLQCIRFSTLRENSGFDRSLVPIWECPDAPHHPVELVVDRQYHFFKNIWFSDNPHLTTKDYYMNQVIPIGMKGNLHQSPEVSLEEASRKNCTWGQYVYGTPFHKAHGRYTTHLDARFRKADNSPFDWEVEDDPYPNKIDGEGLWID
ncbi:MAG: hypothetical protein SGILL_003719 [Bacillariaceae sp.]